MSENNRDLLYNLKQSPKANVKVNKKRQPKTTRRREDYEAFDTTSCSDQKFFHSYQLCDRKTAGNLSISDTAIHLINSSRTQYQSAARMNNRNSIGSMRFLLRPSSSELYLGSQSDDMRQKSQWKQQLTKKNAWLSCYVVFYVCFLVVGGVSFQIFESETEQDIRASVRQTRYHFLDKYPQILDADLEEFLVAVITANDRGISPLRNASNEMNWSFGQALFFSSTVITTIGYGHVTPLSQTGKIFCMLYATIGIPLTLVLLSAVVERLLVPANWLLGTLNSRFGHLYQPFNIRLLHLSIVVILVSFLFFAIPTAVFVYFEPTWGALDAFYYCFISLTTIGLGDYIPGDGVSADNRSLYKIFITCYLVCGLIAMMFVLTIFYDIPQLNLGQLFTEKINEESEKLRLSSNNATCYSGTSGLYIPQRDEDTRRAVVRIRPHGTDSPSPEEAPTPSREMRIP